MEQQLPRCQLPQIALLCFGPHDPSVVTGPVGCGADEVGDGAPRVGSLSSIWSGAASG